MFYSKVKAYLRISKVCFYFGEVRKEGPSYLSFLPGTFLKVYVSKDVCTWRKNVHCGLQIMYIFRNKVHPHTFEGAFEVERWLKPASWCSQFLTQDLRRSPCQRLGRLSSIRLEHILLMSYFQLKWVGSTTSVDFSIHSSPTSSTDFPVGCWSRARLDHGRGWSW